MEGSQSEARRLLDDMSGLRQRVQQQHRRYGLWAALVGIVASMGAVAFYLAPQFETRSCSQQGDLMTCTVSIRGFDDWWVWLGGGAVAVAVVYVRRWRQGTWRPSTAVWVLLVFMALFGLPVVALLMVNLPPIAYPVATAGVLGLIAISRGDLAAALIAATLAGGLLYVSLVLNPDWFIVDNRGPAIGSAVVAAWAFVLAGAWARQDRPS